MNDESRIEIAVIGRNVYVKPTGYATQENCLGLPDFLVAMFKQGCSGVTFDLKECRALDSTCLGVIAAAAMWPGRGKRKVVAILNANEQVRQELRMVGLLSVVALKDEPVEPPAEIELKQIDFVHLPRTETGRIKKVKQLHEELIKLNQKNKEMFSSFVEMLDAELRQDESEE